MDFQSLVSTFKQYTLEIELDYNSKLALNDFITITLSGDERNVILSRLHDPNHKIEIGTLTTIAQDEEWNRIQKENYLARIESMQGSRIFVRVVYGFRFKNQQEPICIGINQGENTESVISEFKNNYILLVNGQAYFMIGIHKHAADGNKTFIVTDGVKALNVNLETKTETDPVTSHIKTSEIYISNKTSISKLEDYSFSVFKGEINVTDSSTVTATKRSAQLYVQAGLAKYINIWKRYAQVEYDIVYGITRKGGVLSYTKETNDGVSGKYTKYTLKINNASENELISFSEAGKEISANDNLLVEIPLPDRKLPDGSPIIILAEVESFIIEDRIMKIKIESTTLSDKTLPPKGQLNISDIPYLLQYKRRMSSFELIEEGESSKSNLSQLIEGTGINPNTKLKKRYTVLSDNIKNTVFKDNPPNDEQAEAIRIALNTPDLAVIQGPPGTGKSTVIKAIVQGISEKTDPDLFFAKNIMSAYQRDATKNMTGSSGNNEFTVYGLPVPSYIGQDQKENEVLDSSIKDWIEKRKEIIKEKNPNLAMYTEVDRYKRLLSIWINSYDVSRSDYSLDISLLKNYKASIYNNVSDELKNEADDIYETLTYTIQDSESVSINAISYAKMLPESEISMADDGEMMVRKTYRYLSRRGKFSDSVIRIMDDLKSLYEADPIDFRKIRKRKQGLLYSLKPETRLLVPMSLNTRIAKLLEASLEYISNNSVTKDELTRILSDFYYNLEENPLEVQNSIKGFLTVVAATHQRAVSKKLLKIKKDSLSPTPIFDPVEGDTDEDKKNQIQEKRQLDIAFDNALLDEAARSCPADLLIPMARTKDRIILVGDHKQLPQFISDKVYDVLEEERRKSLDGNVKSETDEDEIDKILKESMFSYLIKAVEKLTEIDHQERYITLTKQYRMPKILGDLVSDEFYAETPLESPLGDKKPPKLPGIDDCNIAWACIDGGRGRREETTPSKSLINRAEAAYIVRKLQQYKEHEKKTGVKYSYGVITFYKGQSELIKSMLKNKKLDNDIEVGTVDSFQGKEFDVVFLSVVRSSTGFYQKQGYGFVANLNRLCVALSRAKLCLIAVGDSVMIQKDFAKKKVHALYRLYELCKDQNEKRAKLLLEGD